MRIGPNLIVLNGLTQLEKVSVSKKKIEIQNTTFVDCTKKMKNVAKSVIERINRDVGADIANLSHCKNINNEYVTRVAEIEAEVNI